MAIGPTIYGTLGDPGRTKGGASSGKTKRSFDETGPKKDSTALTFDTTGVQEQQDAAIVAAAAIVSGSLGEPTLTFDATATFDTTAITFDQQGYRLFEPQDGAEFLGTASYGEVSGELVAGEGADELAVAGTLVAIGTLDATENSDNIVLAGIVPLVTEATVPLGGGRPYRGAVWGRLEAQEASDEAAFAGAVQTGGQIEAVEEPDAVKFGGAVIVPAQIGIGESGDTASVAGRVEDWIAYDNDFLLAA